MICTGPEPCAHPDECEFAELCLGSDEGVEFQERRMKEFFEWLFLVERD